MSEIQPIPSRPLHADLSTEPGVAQPQGDSDFALAPWPPQPETDGATLQLPVSHEPGTSGLFGHVAEGMAPDPLMAWMEGSNGISAQFAPPPMAEDPALAALIMSVPETLLAPAVADPETADAADTGLASLSPVMETADVAPSPTQSEPATVIALPGDAVPPAAEPRGPGSAEAAARGEAVFSRPASAQGADAAALPASAASAQAVEAKAGTGAEAASVPLRSASVGKADAVDAGQVRRGTAGTDQDPKTADTRRTPTTQPADLASGSTAPRAVHVESVEPRETMRPLIRDTALATPPDTLAAALAETILDPRPSGEALMAGATTRSVSTGAGGVVQGQPHDPRPVMQQVTEALVSTRGDRTEIALSPEELGRVRLIMSGPDRAHIVVWAERPETLELVRRNADMLAQHLAEAGVTADSLDFRQDTRGSRQEPGTFAPSGDDSDPLVAPAALVRMAPAPLSDRRIDIRL
jgi:flagellar hook-length control protein FliK